MVKLKINGQEVTVDENTTILEAARKIGISIPTLCYHPRLRPMGHCRMCLVEVSGVEKPVTACDTPVQEGMEVITDTPKVQELRKSALEMLIAAHPVNGCYTCDRSGNCEFQDFVYEQGITECEVTTDTYRYPVVKDNPFIVRDYEKCILCGRCVEACREVRGRGVLDWVDNGFNSKVTTVKDGKEVSSEEAGCVYCGNCVQVCPVGALVEKNRRYQVREWEMRKVKSICPYCGVGCNLELYVHDNRIVKVMGWDNPEVNQGWLCVKGRFGCDFLHDEGRLTTPLIREGKKGEGKFREASWEEALHTVIRGLKHVKDTYGSDALGVITSAKCTNEENYLIQKFARAVLKTNNVDHCARL
ncbi:formate dehydrogenase alpha subunit [Calderihabitans maritimus]|nr:formate dehydrogenase alpha subunit [Calderihabitans maritimus]